MCKHVHTPKYRVRVCVCVCVCGGGQDSCGHLLMTGVTYGCLDGSGHTVAGFPLGLLRLLLDVLCLFIYLFLG